MIRRVLLTGSTGALGQVLAGRLHADPACFNVFAPRRAESNDPLDLCNGEQIASAIERTRPDLVLHLAATFSNDFDEAYAVNVAATRHILKAVEASGRALRVVLVGSAAEYGPVIADENPIREDHVLRPVSVYGISKAWQTELAYLYASRGLDVTVARVFNLTGPHLSQRLFVGRLHKQIDELLRGERTRIEVGSLSAVRDYLSIDDAVTQLLAIAGFGEAGKVYHVASGRPITMRAVLVRELAAHGLSESIVIEDEGLTNRRGYDVPTIYADISKTVALMTKMDNHGES
jgi:GDP-4-dehydro-6-deoxy-D-mannose reductase